MLYKTIVLDLLQQRPQMHEQLRRERKLLTTLEFYAKELKTSHEVITGRLQREMPDSQKDQICWQAGEMALSELLDRLPPASPADDCEDLPIDLTTVFLGKPSFRG